MKSERRHQLERNELADRIGTGLSSVQSILPALIGGVAILAVVAFVWGVMASSSRKKESTAWTEYYFNLAGGDADSYLSLADQFPKSNAAVWARQTAGSSLLEQGLEALYRNRSEGIEQIEAAIEAFEEVQEKATNDELRAKSLLGLAQAHEALGQLDKATTYYRQYTSSTAPPRSIHAVNEQLAYIGSESGKKFYSWFDKLDPKPDAPIRLPSDLSLPPTEAGFDFGPILDNALKGDSGPIDTESPSVPTPAEIDPSTLPDLPSIDVTPEAPGGLELPDPTDSIELPTGSGTSSGTETDSNNP